jgi:hypothetical protein
MAMMASRSRSFGRAGFRQHRLDLHQLFSRKPGVIMRTLRTILAVLRAAAGLDRQQPALLHLVGVEMFAMNLLRLEQEIVEGQREQRDDLALSPVVAQPVIGARFVVSRRRGVDFGKTHAKWLSVD